MSFTRGHHLHTRSRHHDDPRYLRTPCRELHTVTHNRYYRSGWWATTEAMQEVGHTAVIPYMQFARVWHVHVPHIVVCKPRSDVCNTCDKHRENIRKACTEEEMQSATESLAAHLELAQAENAYYNQCIQSPQQIAEQPCEQPVTQHFTFDFAQQLELPYHTRQVGPIYFKVRYCVQCFGICEESAPQQCNYLFHEAQTVGQDGKSAMGQMQWFR